MRLMSAPGTLTTVLDAGARYGMHPSWTGFGGDLLYFAFEPDSDEATRLRAQNTRRDYEVVEMALAATEGERAFHITEHRGYCSFFEPDLQSDWFKHQRPGEGEIQAVIRVRTQTLDDFAEKRQVNFGFLKLDTEGSELEVLEGGARQVASHVLWIRTSMYFAPSYKNQPLFADFSKYLLPLHYFLLNLDYFGRGVPRLNLYRDPDPLSPDQMRYGTLISADGVWLRKYDWVCERFKDNREAWSCATLKYAYFCMLNHAPDVALDTLLRFVEDAGGAFTPEVTRTALYIKLRRVCAEFLGRWRVCPDTHWQLAQSIGKRVFDIDLHAGHKYWELIQSL